MNKTSDRIASPLLIAAIIVTGFLYYISNGLTGNFWYLLWIAPVPVLLVAFNSSWKTTFTVAFIAYAIGRMSWFSYLVNVATIAPAIIFTILLSLIFALIVLVTRLAVTRNDSWLSVFAFPAFFTFFEFLLTGFSPDGTAASIAYSQSDFLPLVQIASLAGISGITFVVCFISSAIALIIYHRSKKKPLTKLITISAVLILVVFAFGIFRLNQKPGGISMDAGLVVLEEKYHHITNQPETDKEKITAELYAKEISSLAQKGAKIVVLPERAINIAKENEADIVSLLSNTARQNNTFIVAGYTNFRMDKNRNSCLVINNEGKIIADYNKAHLVTGLEAQFTPGKEPGFFSFTNTKTGTAICKDMDFPYYINKYGSKDVSILFIPAWDFVTDDWLHSRMAIIRGIENGFSEVRAARQGRLTISDAYGRVTNEASCANGNAASLMGKVNFDKQETFYLRYGNWLGIICSILSASFIFYSLRKNKNS
jgi:apolipoprotein N-acyltransferase